MPPNEPRINVIIIPVPCSVAKTACPAAKSMDFCTSEVAIAYWLLRLSIAKALLEAK